MFKGRVEVGRFDFDKLADKVRAKLGEVYTRRVESVRQAMTDGLRKAATEALVTAKVTGEDTEALARAAADAQKVEFRAHEEPATIVEGVERRRSVVSPAGEPDKTGLTPDQVSRAFEFGSVAQGTPSTAFTQQVVDGQRRESARDIEEVKKAIL